MFSHSLRARALHTALTTKVTDNTHCMESLLQVLVRNVFDHFAASQAHIRSSCIGERIVQSLITDSADKYVELFGDKKSLRR